jgi:replicative DNA helicase
MKPVGGHYYLIELSNKVASAANIEHHARIIAQQYFKRALIEEITRLQADAYEETTDAFDLLDKARQTIMDIGPKFDGGAVTIGQAGMLLLQQIDRELSGNENRAYTGLSDVDRLLQGIVGGEMCVVAARPGGGKTQFALMVAKHGASHGKSVHFVSLEMTNEQMAGRLVADMCGIDGEKLRNPKSLKPDELRKIQDATNDLHGLNMTLAGIRNPENLYQYVRSLKANGGIDVLIVDYLQLMSVGNPGRNSNREQEIAAISRTLKRIARDFNIPVIALAQLSRAVESRADKWAVMADLRESGAIENDADIILFLQRPENWGWDSFEFANTGKHIQASGAVVMTFGKFRGGNMFRQAVLSFTGGKLKDFDWSKYGGNPSTWHSDYMPTEEDAPPTFSISPNSRPSLEGDIPF